MPDSLLAAANKVAEAARLRQTEVNAVYRSIQGAAAPALPKSTGRNVWYADPAHVARLLIALAGKAAGLDPMEAVQAFSDATIGGVPLFNFDGPAGTTRKGDRAPTLQDALAAILSDPTLADQVDHVELRETGSVEIQFAEASNRPAELYRPSERDTRLELLFSDRRLVLRPRWTGEFFAELARSVDWRGQGDPPYRMAPDSQSPEAGV